MKSLLALFLLALLVRLGFLALFSDPAYPDSYYYADVARSLVAGHGFNVNFIWIFVEVGGRLPADPVLPIPSNAHWMPLAELVQVPFMALFGSDSAFAAGLPFAFAGATAAPLTWLIAREAGARPAVQLGAGILVAIPAASVVFFSQPDNFSLYEPLVAGALWMTARGLKGRPWSFALAGALVGVATLARNDGVLVGLAIAIAFLWSRWQGRHAGRPHSRTSDSDPSQPGALGASAAPLSPAPSSSGVVVPVWAAVACFGAFVLVVAPWFARQLAVFGSLSPSSASGRVLLIRSMHDFNSIVSDVSLQGFLGQGLGPLIESRVLGFVAAVGIYTVVVGMFFLVPFMLIGAWQRRRSIDFGPFFLYTGILFAFSGLVSAIHVPGGTFIHSAVALAPYSYILALEGIAASAGWVARRRSTWDQPTATKVFIGGAIALAVAAGLGYGLVVQGGWNVVRQQRITVAQQLDRLGASTEDRLMSIDAGGYMYWTGRGGVVTPDDSIDTIETVARAYDVRWLVLERREIVDALRPVLRGTDRPTWIGPPAFTLQQPATDPEVAAYPAVAIYPVCFAALDARCAAAASVAAP